MKPADILVIEDDEQIRRILQTTLTAERYGVQEASTVAGGTLLATQRYYDAIILDLRLPDGNGMEVIRKVRQSKKATPIIVLSSCFDESEKIAALDTGADDLVGKPIALGELLARLRVILRRSAEARGRMAVAIYRTGAIEVDLNRRRVEIAGNEIRLTPIEYKLLELLIRHADQIVTYARLLKEVWGTGAQQAQLSSLRIYMRQLRRKLEVDPAQPRYLLTHPALGYRIKTQHVPESWLRTAPSENLNEIFI
jgi:two-component system KDP operon response regulator KdpE